MRGKPGHGRRVLIVSYYFPPMASVAGLRAFYFARDLARFGYQVLVLTSSSDETLHAHELEELPRHCRVVRVRSWYRFGQDVSLEALAAAARLALRPGFDLVLGTAPTWSSIKTALLIARFSRRPLLADIRDPWTYGRLWWSRGRLHLWREKLWERLVLRQARRIIYIDPQALRSMQSRVPAHLAEKMCSIPHGFDPLPREPARPGPQDVCLFSHMGSLEAHSRPPDRLFQAFGRACQQPEFARQARLVLFGNVGKHRQAAEALGWGAQVVFAGQVSRSQSFHAMEGSDVLVYYQIHAQAREAPSTKIYEYLAARRPILALCAQEGSAAELVRATGTSRLVEARDVGRMAGGFLELWQAWKQGRLREHSLDLSPYTRRHRSEQLAAELEAVLSAGSGAAR